MKIKPILGKYEIPGIQRIGTMEGRHLIEALVPGLEGAYYQDLGSRPVMILIEGTLSGDKARDDFLNDIRAKFKTGDPIDFVADIITATQIAQVLVSDLKVSEVAGSADTFRYSITLAQYVKPPSTASGSELGFGDLKDLDKKIDLEAKDLFDIMQVPDLLGSIPDFGDPTKPLMSSLDGIKSSTAGMDKTLNDLKGLFGV